MKYIWITIIILLFASPVLGLVSARPLDDISAETSTDDDNGSILPLLIFGLIIPLIGGLIAYYYYFKVISKKQDSSSSVPSTPLSPSSSPPPSLSSSELSPSTTLTSSTSTSAPHPTASDGPESTQKQSPHSHLPPLPSPPSTFSTELPPPISTPHPPVHEHPKPTTIPKDFPDLSVSVPSHELDDIGKYRKEPKDTTAEEEPSSSPSAIETLLSIPEINKFFIEEEKYSHGPLIFESHNQSFSINGNSLTLATPDQETTWTMGFDMEETFTHHKTIQRNGLITNQRTHRFSPGGGGSREGICSITLSMGEITPESGGTAYMMAFGSHIIDEKGKVRQTGILLAIMEDENNFQLEINLDSPVSELTTPPSIDLKSLNLSLRKRPMQSPISPDNNRKWWDTMWNLLLYVLWWHERLEPHKDEDVGKDQDRESGEEAQVQLRDCFISWATALMAAITNLLENSAHTNRNTKNSPVDQQDLEKLLVAMDSTRSPDITLSDIAVLFLKPWNTFRNGSPEN